MEKYINRHNKNYRLDKKAYKEFFIGSWAGMRGVVSLAIAMSLPMMLLDKTAFPMRNEILFITFIVIVVTLLVHGLSLPFIVRKLKVCEPMAPHRQKENELRTTLLTKSIEFINQELSAKYSTEIINAITQDILKTLSHMDGSPNFNSQEKHNFLHASHEIIGFQRKFLNSISHKGDYRISIIRSIEEDIDLRHVLITKHLDD